MTKKIRKVLKTPRDAAVDVKEGKTRIQPVKGKLAKEDRKSKYQIDADEF